MNGAVVYLENPGSIIIMDCVFYHNSGFSGTSIYYMEIQDQSIMSLSNNSFEHNFALHGAAGVFLNNKYDQLNPLQNNTFRNNTGYNMETPPFKINLNNSNIKFFTQKKYSFNLIPGVSTISLTFKIVDYYGNQISYYNGSMVKLQIKNKDFSDYIGDSINIEGIPLASIFNGHF